MVKQRKKRDISIKVGDVYKTNSYGNVTVLDVKAYNAVTVEFENTGNKQITTGASVVSGMLTDKKLFDETKLMFVGKICSTKSCGDAEIISVNGTKCTIKFLNSGNIQIVESGNLRKGLVKDKALFEEEREYKVGSIYKTKSYGEVEVVDIVNSHNVLVKFLNTGNVEKVSSGNLKKGNISDRKSFEDSYKFKVGDVIKSNNYGDFTILEFVNGAKAHVLVRFHDTGSVVKTTLSQVGSGAVKDPESTVFAPKHLGTNRFCVYIHKDSEGVVRYVGQGLYKRAKAILGRNSKWNELFKETKPIVEYVKQGISKRDAEELEQELILRHSDTIVNHVKNTSKAREMDFDLFNKYFYVSEDSCSGLKFKVEYNNHVKDEDAYDSMPKGYYVVYLNKKYHLVHRIVWLLTHGAISKDMVIDHKNLNRSDNSLSNLALVDMSHNMRNRMLPLPSSGYRNISMKTYKNGIVSFTVNYTKPLHDASSKVVFSTTKYEDSVIAFMEAYAYREKLISDGVLMEVIKSGEKPIEEMKLFLKSSVKE